MFKHDKDKHRVLHLHPLVLIILFDMKYYCDLNGMRYEVTSTVSTQEEDEALSRRSSTHRTGRAVDLSVRGWSEEETKHFIEYFSDKYNHLGAYSKASGKNKVIVHHNSGHGDHIHVQINYRYRLPVKTEEQLK